MQGATEQGASLQAGSELGTKLGKSGGNNRHRTG